MTDENKDICPETPENPDLPETPEAAPEEPKEVVSWYIPKEPQGREVVSYYVQRDPMPQNVWQQAAKKEKRRSRLWLWISLAVLAVTVAAVVLAAILGGSSGSGQHRPLPDGDGDNPSSIVDIFGSKATSIPRIQGDPGVRLACRDPQGQPLTAQEVYAKVNPSVVTVVSEQSEGASIGTGVIMTSDGYIITNAHVISGGKSCWVALDTGVTYEVNLVGFDEEEDLAVLKADPQNPLPAAEFGNSDLVQVGDTAYAIGNPLGVELRGTMTELFAASLRRGEGGAPTVEEVRRKNLALQQERAELLARMDLAEDALDDKPACPLCGDTGWRGTEMCRCLRALCAQEQIRELSKLLDLGEQSFDSFSLDYYSPLPWPGESLSPRENMELVYEVCLNYAQKFGRFPIRNLFLTGAPGLGKTFLSACIARTVSEKGFSVVYDTAVNIFTRFEEQKFARDKLEAGEARDETRRYLGCDLLILDDLGSELTTPFVQSALYTLINARLTADKGTVISSNLTMDQVRARYTPQIASRLEGEYRVLPFYGEVIRLLRKQTL